MTTEESSLAALALMAQQARFTTPAPRRIASGASDLAAIEDPRPILPEAARGALRRLLLGGRSEVDEMTLRGVFDRLRDFGYRLHPFDLPRLGTTLKRHEDRLGPSERAYLRGIQDASAAPADGLLDQPITAETWTDYPRAARLDFLRGQRREDPEVALTLIQDCFGSEPANIRADLIEVLQIGLSEVDRPFLESLDKDRARKVKERAQDLLGCIRGSAAYQDRLALALERLSIKKGLLDRRQKLSYKPPSTGKTPAPASSFPLSHLWISDLCQGLGVSLDSLPTLLSKDDNVLVFALMGCALAEGRADMLEALGKTLAEFDIEFGLEAMAEQLWRQPRSLQAEVIRLLFALDPWKQLPSAGTWQQIYAILEAPLPEAIAARLLESKAWRRQIEELAKEDAQSYRHAVLEAVAVVLPAGLGPQFLESIQALPAGAGRAAAGYTEFLVALHAAGPTPRDPSRKEPGLEKSGV